MFSVCAHQNERRLAANALICNTLPHISRSVYTSDINYLKETNDTFGHDTGNQLISTVAQIISGVFKRSPVFRIGGDEFVVVLRDRDLNTYTSLLEDFDEQCRTESIEFADKKIKISVAHGIAVYNTETDKNFADVFNRADDAMYENKHAIKAKDKAHPGV